MFNILRTSILPISVLKLSTIEDILGGLGLIEQRFGCREVSLNRLRKLQILINIDYCLKALGRRATSRNYIILFS